MKTNQILMLSALGIGAIINNNQTFTACVDGSYSTASKYPCRTRGGVSKKQNKQPKFLSKTGAGYACADTYLVPLNKIHTNEKLFQNREDDFSLESVNRIINAVKKGSFKWQVFDPILLWLSPSGKLYVLSGHSRTKAFRMLSKSKYKVDGQDFKRIPAKIIKVGEKEAVQIALMSNTLSTPETPVERAIYYRNLLINGIGIKEVQELAQLYEGRNASSILRYAMLNPNGKAINAIKLLQKGDPTSRKQAEKIALWIGDARIKFPQLTNIHENEIYDYLARDSKGIIKSSRDFNDLLKRAIERQSNTGEFDNAKPLNLQNNISKSPTIQAFEKELYRLKKELDKATKLRDNKFNEFVKRGASEKEIKRAIEKYDNAVTAFRRKYMQQLKMKMSVEKADKKQASLFGFR